MPETVTHDDFLRALHSSRKDDCHRYIRQINADRDRLRAELEWYGEQARLARLIHKEGDEGRNNLAADGGKRARIALGIER